jgi:hypothetical protein
VTPRSFKTSSTPRNASPIPGYETTTCSGTSGPCHPRAPTK